MDEESSILHWIDKQSSEMLELVKKWADINSGSDNLPGLSRMLQTLQESFASLEGKITIVDLPSRSLINDQGQKLALPHGKALHIVKHPEAPFKIFLGGHMDTVYSESHPFQLTSIQNSNILQGPGVADMKGGLVVMLTALKAFERNPISKNIGWEIVINPDEEIGSIGSEGLLKECAKRCNVGLIFEPAFADGAFVDSRKGSANFTVTAKGKAAHAGRDFDKGSNAIAALANFIDNIRLLSDLKKEISVNVGYIIGGGPVNIVPDFALCRLNIRASTLEDFEAVQTALEVISSEAAISGTTLQLHMQNSRDPKPFDEKTKHLFQLLEECAKQEGFLLQHRQSGGVCDGNLLSQEGLPVIDSLGVVGGGLHTSEEYLLIDSLAARAKLTARLLCSLASNTQLFRRLI
jgi:glutamate carboxypeptidase